MFFPNEILNKIGSNTENYYEYIKVSHHWLTIFQPCLYSHVHITSKKQWRQFQTTIMYLNVNLAKLVKHVNFEYRIGFTKQEFEQLATHCPLLESLDFNPKLWKYLAHSKVRYERITKLPALNCYSLDLIYTHGISLTDLTLLCADTMHRMLKSLPVLLESTPYLQSLCLYGRDKSTANAIASYEQSRFTLKDILKLHDSLPMLQELKLLDFVISIQPNEDFPLQHQFPSIRTLIVQGTLTHDSWFAVIAQLYPELHTLELNQSWHPASSTLRQFEGVKNGLILIANQCRSLKRVRIVPLNSVSRDTYICFYRHIQGLLVSVDGTVRSSLTNLELLFESILQCCDIKKMDTLRLQLWRNLHDVNQVMKPLSKFEQLKELELSCGKHVYTWSYGCDIDTILNCCQQLKILKLTRARLTIKNEKAVVKDGSDIECIELKQVHFTTDSINVLSSWSPNLKVLKLIKCVKDRDELDQRIDIYLPIQSLQTLVIEDIYLGLNQFIENSSIDAAFLAVKRKESTRRWYHLCQGRSNRRQLRRLNADQSERVKNYVMKETDWDKLEQHIIRGTYRQPKYWENDLHYGYVYIHCKSIVNLLFNNVLL
ncbi:hypothetical protein MFLAVUS_002831 [Mucor flavus]|uniref:F-box domain-containing protein n=1 Tax=Mucor flavus TaxID=439312 RepID=A0ABP9YRD3_9FUNG